MEVQPSDDAPPSPDGMMDSSSDDNHQIAVVEDDDEVMEDDLRRMDVSKSLFVSLQEAEQQLDRRIGSFLLASNATIPTPGSGDSTHVSRNSSLYGNLGLDELRRDLALINDESDGTETETEEERETDNNTSAADAAVAMNNNNNNTNHTTADSAAAGLVSIVEENSTDLDTDNSNDKRNGGKSPVAKRKAPPPLPPPSDNSPAPGTPEQQARNRSETPPPSQPSAQKEGEEEHHAFVVRGTWGFSPDHARNTKQVHHFLPIPGDSPFETKHIEKSSPSPPRSVGAGRKKSTTTAPAAPPPDTTTATSPKAELRNAVQTIMQTNNNKKAELQDLVHSMMQLPTSAARALIDEPVLGEEGELAAESKSDDDEEEQKQFDSSSSCPPTTKRGSKRGQMLQDYHNRRGSVTNVIHNALENAGEDLDRNLEFLNQASSTHQAGGGRRNLRSPSILHSVGQSMMSVDDISLGSMQDELNAAEAFIQYNVPQHNHEYNDDEDDEEEGNMDVVARSTPWEPTTGELEPPVSDDEDGGEPPMEEILDATLRIESPSSKPTSCSNAPNFRNTLHPASAAHVLTEDDSSAMPTQQTLSHDDDGSESTSMTLTRIVEQQHRGGLIQEEVAPPTLSPADILGRRNSVSHSIHHTLENAEEDLDKSLEFLKRQSPSPGIPKTDSYGAVQQSMLSMDELSLRSMQDELNHAEEEFTVSHDDDDSDDELGVVPRSTPWMTMMTAATAATPIASSSAHAAMLLQRQDRERDNMMMIDGGVPEGSEQDDSQPANSVDSGAEESRELEQPPLLEDLEVPAAGARRVVGFDSSPRVSLSSADGDADDEMEMEDGDDGDGRRMSHQSETVEETIVFEQDDMEDAGDAKSEAETGEATVEDKPDTHESDAADSPDEISPLDRKAATQASFRGDSPTEATEVSMDVDDRPSEAMVPELDGTEAGSSIFLSRDDSSSLMSPELKYSDRKHISPQSVMDIVNVQLAPLDQSEEENDDPDPLNKSKSWTSPVPSMETIPEIRDEKKLDDEHDRVLEQPVAVVEPKPLSGMEPQALSRSQTEDATEAPTKSKSSALLIRIWLVLLVLVSGVVYYSLSRSQDPELVTSTDQENAPSLSQVVTTAGKDCPADYLTKKTEEVQPVATPVPVLDSGSRPTKPSTAPMKLKTVHLEDGEFKTPWAATSSSVQMTRKDFDDEVGSMLHHWSEASEQTSHHRRVRRNTRMLVIDRASGSSQSAPSPVPTKKMAASSPANKKKPPTKPAGVTKKKETVAAEQPQKPVDPPTRQWGMMRLKRNSRMLVVNHGTDAPPTPAPSWGKPSSNRRTQQKSTTHNQTRKQDETQQERQQPAWCKVPILNRRKQCAAS